MEFRHTLPSYADERGKPGNAYVNSFGSKELNLSDGAAEAKPLNGATMPNGQKYEDWLKDKKGHKEDE
ncbi:MAG TPA: hypothetical protein VKA82_21850 [Rubrobacter sp.]|jgi:hypothetical protein|nr:hypothetical protein [Rubrobacter sp.]